LRDIPKLTLFLRRKTTSNIMKNEMLGSGILKIIQMARYVISQGRKMKWFIRIKIKIETLLESSHFSALRVGIKDFKRTVNREVISNITKSMQPRTWMKYCSTNLVIKIIRDYHKQVH